MSMMKQFPVSILLFLATGFIYVLQLFPGVGVLLMIFAAPLWSIVTVNLGFSFMVYEVYTGKIPRWMVIFPCLYFGIYAYFAVVSHMHLYQMQHKIAEINRSAHISFDPFVSHKKERWRKASFGSLYSITAHGI